MWRLLSHPRAWTSDPGAIIHIFGKKPRGHNVHEALNQKCEIHGHNDHAFSFFSRVRLERKDFPLIWLLFNIFYRAYDDMGR